MMPDALSLGEAPDHSVLAKPWTYEISEFHLVNGPEPTEPPHIDLVLRNGDDVQRLRFDGVREVQIQPEFWYPNIGLEILDVSDRGWDGIGVRVNSYEGDELRFWARSVVALNMSAVELAAAGRR